MSLIPLILFALLVFASNTRKTSRYREESSRVNKKKSNLGRTFTQSIKELEKRMDTTDRSKGFSRSTDNPTINRSIGKTSSKNVNTLESLREDRKAYNREQYMKSLYDEDDFEFTDYDNDNSGEMENWENLGTYSINKLYNKESMTEAVILKEILDKPLALRK